MVFSVDYLSHQLTNPETHGDLHGLAPSTLQHTWSKRPLTGSIFWNKGSIFMIHITLSKCAKWILQQPHVYEGGAKWSMGVSGAQHTVKQIGSVGITEHKKLRFRDWNWRNVNRNLLFNSSFCSVSICVHHASSRFWNLLCLCVFSNFLCIVNNRN